MIILDNVDEFFISSMQEFQEEINSDSTNLEAWLDGEMDARMLCDSLAGG